MATARGTSSQVAVRTTCCWERLVHGAVMPSCPGSCQGNEYKMALQEDLLEMQPPLYTARAWTSMSQAEEEAALRLLPEFPELLRSDTEDEEFNGFRDLEWDREFGKLAMLCCLCLRTHHLWEEFLGSGTLSNWSVWKSWFWGTRPGQQTLSFGMWNVFLIKAEWELYKRWSTTNCIGGASLYA